MTFLLSSPPVRPIITFLLFILLPNLAKSQIIQGCSDLTAINYSPIVNLDDGSCLYSDACGNVINQDALGYSFFASKDASHWTVDLDGANGSANFSGHRFILTGSELGFIQEAWTQVYMITPISGNYSFDWTYITEDYSPFVDPAAYIANDNYIPLSGNGNGNVQNGTASFFGNAGQYMGWLVRSTDSVGGRAYLYISNFTYPVECVFGCTYPDATNYNVNASEDNGTCIFVAPEICPADLNNDLTINAGDLLLLIAAYGSPCP